VNVVTHLEAWPGAGSSACGVGRDASKITSDRSAVSCALCLARLVRQSWTPVEAERVRCPRCGGPVLLSCVYVGTSSDGRHADSPTIPGRACCAGPCIPTGTAGSNKGERT
jgi:hypothetical protein